MLKYLLSCIFIFLLCGTAPAEEKKVEVPVGNSPSQGPVDAPITLIEFIDFQ
jgi:hypothetical protein